MPLVVRPVGLPQVVAVVVVILKFVLLISKKIFPTASIFILAEAVTLFGTTIGWEPSLGVVSAKTTGKVRPPSVLKVIFTLAQLIGARLVEPTLQVIF